MKSRKLLLPTIIIVVAIIAMSVYSVVGSIAKKPTVTEGKFPFSITYELNGETVTINDVYVARYDRNGGYADTKSRIYVGEIGDMGEGNTIYTLKKDENTKIELWTHFYPDYLMGDPMYTYFDNEAFEPKIYYYDAEGTEFGDEETLSAQGVKLVSFEYPKPIENTLVFSHISYFSGEVVLPTVIIALLSLVVIIIFVKKDSKLKCKPIDKVSITLNLIISILILPFVTIFGMFIDIEGGGPEFYRQITYFIPAFIVLCLSASVALRRKGCGKKSLVATIIGPAAFAIDLIVSFIVELF